MLFINSLHVEVSVENDSCFSTDWHTYKELAKLYLVICTLFNYSIHT